MIQPLRCWATIAAALAFAPAIGCGGSSEGGASNASVDASIEDCSPQQVTALPACVPPRTPRSACTDTQIQTYYSDCWSGTTARALDGMAHRAMPPTRSNDLAALTAYKVLSGARQSHG
jgi:hypothetical protein